MFTRQAPAIHTALWQGGLSPAQASQVQNLLGQCRATLVHRGPISVDPTTPSMRLVDPASARAEFPEIEDIQPPEHKPKPKPDPEQPDPPPDPPWPPQQPPNWPPDLPPGGPGPQQEITAGPYVQVDGGRVQLKHKHFKPGRHCIFQDGFVRGIDIKARDISDELAGEQRSGNHIVIRINDLKPDQTVVECGISNLRRIMVVTDVRFYPDGVPGESTTEPVFRVTSQPILAWTDGEPAFYDLPLAKCSTDSESGSGSGAVYVKTDRFVVPEGRSQEDDGSGWVQS